MHFCSKLAAASGEIHTIVEREMLSSDMMYIWIEIQYRVLASPFIMHVHYELMPIAPLANFKNLTTVEKASRYNKLYFSKWSKFRREYGEQIENEEMFQFGNRLRRRRQPKDQK